VAYWVACAVFSLTALAMRALVIYCAPGKIPGGVGVGMVGEGPTVAGGVFLAFVYVVWELFEDKSD